MKARRSAKYGPPEAGVVRGCRCARPRFVEGDCLYCGKAAVAPVVASPAALAERAVPALGVRA